MDAGLDGRFGVFGKETGRRLENNGLDAAFDHLLVARQARKAASLIDAQGVAAGIGAVLEVVGNGVEIVAAVFPEQPGDPASATAAADQTELDFSFGRAGLGILRRSRGGESRRTIE